MVLALAYALGSAPAGMARSAELPTLPQLIEQLRPPGEARNQAEPAPAPASALNSPRARPVVADPVPEPRTTAPEGTAATALALPFQSGSASLTPDAERMLEALGRVLNSPELARYRFRIEGHSDTSGDAPVNMTLSERRAVTVREYLVSRQGVAASRLDAVGLGETQLLVQTPDSTAEPRNRRVQILNVGS